MLRAPQSGVAMLYQGRQDGTIPLLDEKGKFIMNFNPLNVRKMATEGDPNLPNAFLRVTGEGFLEGHLFRDYEGSLRPENGPEEIFLQRSGCLHEGSPRAPIVYKVPEGRILGQLQDYPNMPVVYWATVLNGNRTVASLPDVFIVIVNGEM